MNQAVLITAYKDAAQIKRLIGKLKGFAVYVHIDKKCPQLYEDIRGTYRNISSVTIVSKYRVGWGSYNHLKAVLLLLNMVRKNDAISLVHIVSGQDYPVSTDKEFDQICCDAKIHMTCTPIGNVGDSVKKRYKNYHFAARFFDITSRNYRRFDRKLQFLEKI